MGAGSVLGCKEESGMWIREGAQKRSEVQHLKIEIIYFEQKERYDELQLSPTLGKGKVLGGLPMQPMRKEEVLTGRSEAVE